MNELDRFIVAQDDDHAGLAAALAELQAGRKQGHWIWYVFPQLAGLGMSSMSQRYGLRGREEVAAYLRHDELRDRYARAVDVVAEHMCRLQPPALATLMGSEIDARKLVSSLTLFEQVATSLADHAGDDGPEARLAEEISGVLAVADAQGYDRCAFTQWALATPDAAPAGGER